MSQEVPIETIREIWDAIDKVANKANNKHTDRYGVGLTLGVLYAYIMIQLREFSEKEQLVIVRNAATIGSLAVRIPDDNHLY